ncbi:oligosaccharide flippase family protein [Micromonospora sp. NPDC049366]|uniref:oligosaccharide flippase family protein n=1 Tax=Micromonospora sp. NPDC049366 TaxID=3364271 RepID=UPI0037AD204F
MTQPDAAAVPAPPADDLGGKVRRGLAWGTIGSLALRLGNFGLGVVMARLLAPEEFGVFAVALTIQVILTALVELGMTSDLVRHGSIAERGPTAATIAVVVSVCLAGATSALAGPLASAMGSADAAPVVRVMSLTLVLVGLATVPYAVIQRDFRQSAQFAVDGAGLVVSVVLTPLLAVLGFGAMSLALARVASQGVSTVIQFVVARTWPRFGFRREIAGSLVRFGLPLASANLLSWMVMNAPFAVVGRTGGALMLGFYVLAFNMASWPMLTLGQAIRVVALPGFAQITDVRRRADALPRAIGLSWSVALLVGVGLSTLASVVIPLIYGDRWLPAAQALGGLAFFGSLRIVLDLVTTYLIAVGATRAVLVIQAVWLVVLVPAMAIGISGWGLAGAGWAHVVIGVLVVLPAYAIALRPHGLQLGAALRNLAVPLLAGVPATAAGLLAVDLVHDRLLALLIGGSVTTVVYAALLVRWARRRLAELKAVGTAEPPQERPEIALVSP